MRRTLALMAEPALRTAPGFLEQRDLQLARRASEGFA